MPRKSKIAIVEKARITQYIAGNISREEAARQAGVDHNVITERARIYRREGALQYTNRTFHHKLEKAGMTQSMSRVAHCIDNGPMESFWGILKRERYYGREFTSKQLLIQTIESYISYYNTRRVQRNLGVLAPLVKLNLSLSPHKKRPVALYTTGRKYFIFFPCPLDGMQFNLPGALLKLNSVSGSGKPFIQNFLKTLKTTRIKLPREPAKYR